MSFLNIHELKDSLMTPVMNSWLFDSVIVCRILDLRFPGSNPSVGISQNTCFELFQVSNTILILLIMGVNIGDFGSHEFCKLLFQWIFLYCRASVQKNYHFLRFWVLGNYLVATSNLCIWSDVSLVTPLRHYIRRAIETSFRHALNVIGRVLEGCSKGRHSQGLSTASFDPIPVWKAKLQLKVGAVRDQQLKASGLIWMADWVHKKGAIYGLAKASTEPDRGLIRSLMSTICSFVSF